MLQRAAVAPAAPHRNGAPGENRHENLHSYTERSKAFKTLISWV
jgi:hypothetical protein